MPEVGEAPRPVSERPIIERSPDGGVVRIRKPEAEYIFDYGDHETPRNPDDIPPDTTRLVVEGSAFTPLWASERYVHVGVKDMGYYEALVRKGAGLPIEEEKITIDQNLLSDIIERYRDHKEYTPLFPNIESRKTPFVVADMEFRDSVQHVVAAVEAIDKVIGNIGDKIAEALPGIAADAAYDITDDLRAVVNDIKDSVSEKFEDTKVFDAMVYPSIVALAEGAIGAALLKNIIQARGEKIGRRDFFRKMVKGAKAATVAWLTMPAIEAALFASKGIQGDFIPPEWRKLVEKTHPETWLFILTMRNVVLAHKEQWLAEHLASEQPDGEKPLITTTIGSAHTGLEDQLLKSPEERIKFLRAVQPLLLQMFEPSTIDSMAEFRYNGDNWDASNFYEVPDLKQLIPSESSEDKNKQWLEVKKGTIDSYKLQEFKEGEHHSAQLDIDDNPDKSPPFGSVYFRVKKKGEDGRMLVSMVIIPEVPRYKIKNFSDPARWNFGKLRGENPEYNNYKYETHILSSDLGRDLDIAPFGVDPIARLRNLGHLMPEITRTNEQFNEEIKKDNKVTSIEDYYGSAQNGIQILFYIDEKGLEEITKNGCSILIEERKYQGSNPSRHIITATPKTK